MYLLITAAVPDSADPTGPPRLFTHTFLLDCHETHDRETFLAAVLRCVVQLETHEAMEYLKASGERVKNPHPTPGTVLYS